MADRKFAYSPEEWTRIRNLIHVTDETATTIRQRLERIGMEYREYALMNSLVLPAGPRRDQWRDVERAADRLREALRAIADKTVPIFGPPEAAAISEDQERYSRFEFEVEDIAVRAKSHADFYTTVAAHYGGRKNPDREAVFEDVLGVWIEVLQRDLAITTWNGSIAGPYGVSFMPLSNPSWVTAPRKRRVFERS